jgi:hypothetical protein
LYAGIKLDNKFEKKLLNIENKAENENNLRSFLSKLDDKKSSGLGTIAKLIPG